MISNAKTNQVSPLFPPALGPLLTPFYSPPFSSIFPGRPNLDSHKLRGAYEFPSLSPFWLEVHHASFLGVFVSRCPTWARLCSSPLEPRTGFMTATWAFLPLTGTGAAADRSGPRSLSLLFPLPPSHFPSGLAPSHKKLSRAPAACEGLMGFSEATRWPYFSLCGHCPDQVRPSTVLSEMVLGLAVTGQIGTACRKLGVAQLVRIRDAAGDPGGEVAPTHGPRTPPDRSHTVTPPPGDAAQRVGLGDGEQQPRRAGRGEH